MNESIYKTACLETAAAIMTAGAELINLERAPDRKSFFIFKKDQRLEEILAMHTRQRLTLPSHLLLANLKFLKTRVKECS